MAVERVMGGCGDRASFLHMSPNNIIATLLESEWLWRRRWLIRGRQTKEVVVVTAHLFTHLRCWVVIERERGREPLGDGKPFSFTLSSTTSKQRCWLMLGRERGWAAEGEDVSGCHDGAPCRCLSSAPFG